MNTFFTSHSYYLCVCVTRPLKTDSLSRFQIYSAVVLNVTTMLYIRSPEITHFITESLHPLKTVSLFSPTPSIWKPPLYSASRSLTILVSTHKWNHMAFVLLCLASFTWLHVPQVPMLLHMARFPSFLWQNTPPLDHIYYIFFFRSSTDGHLGCFHLLYTRVDPPTWNLFLKTVYLFLHPF